MIETRAYESTFQIRDVAADGRNLEGVAVPYDVWASLGWFRELHAPRSLKRSTDHTPNLPLLLFHDNRNFSIGHAIDWKHDDDGLRGVWRLNSSRDAQDAAQQVRDGDLTGMSIGFAPIRSEWTLADDWDPTLGPEHMDAVVRTESRLLEVSLTPTPAFVDAQVTAIRS